jgi:hypothetical protein
MGPMGLSPMSAATAAATTAVRVRSFLSREEVAALTARLERLPLQPYTSWYASRIPFPIQSQKPPFPFV